MDIEQCEVLELQQCKNVILVFRVTTTKNSLITVVTEDYLS